MLVDLAPGPTFRASPRYQPLPRANPLTTEPLWHLYLLRCANGDLYTGITTDVQRRLDQHASNRGARRLRGQGPLQLVFSCEAGNRSRALRLELQVKKLSRVQKEALVDGRRGLPILASEQG